VTLNGEKRIHFVSQKRDNLLLLLCVSRIWTYFNIICRHILEETRNKTVDKVPALHIKYVPAIPWEIQSDRLSRQRSNYKYILMYWIATCMTSSYCLKNCKRCSKSHHLYIMCSKCLPPARTLARMRWHRVANLMFNSSIIQICPFLMRRFSSSTSEILVRAAGGNFEHTM